MSILQTIGESYKGCRRDRDALAAIIRRMRPYMDDDAFERAEIQAEISRLSPAVKDLIR